MLVFVKIAQIEEKNMGTKNCIWTPETGEFEDGFQRPDVEAYMDGQLGCHAKTKAVDPLTFVFINTADQMAAYAFSRYWVSI